MVSSLHKLIHVEKVMLTFIHFKTFAQDTFQHTETKNTIGIQKAKISKNY